jgi:hypothetical protein
MHVTGKSHRIAIAMSDYDRAERTSWRLTLTQPSATESRLGGSLCFIKLRRAATRRFATLVNWFFG